MRPPEPCDTLTEEVAYDRVVMTFPVRRSHHGLPSVAVSDSTVRAGLQADTVRKAERLTWLWRNASAMGVKHTALVVVVVASLLAVAAPVFTLELGELQAVPGNHPPYLFRLAIASSPFGSADPPAVTVRRPHDALSLAKHNRLELRLHSLTDVELEVSQGGQTVNRLLLKSELQTARARLDATTAWQRYQAARAKGAARPHLTALLDTAYHTHQTWGQFDPAAARQPLAQIEQERLRVLAAGGSRPEPIVQEAPARAPSVAEPKPLAPAMAGAPDPAMLEGEMQGIREEIRSLMGGVSPWEGPSTPAWHIGEGSATLVLTLVLGGLCLAGVTSLCTGYLLQRSTLERERQRRRVLAASLRRVHAELTSGTSTLPMAQRVQLAGDRHDGLEPVTVVRHVRVSQKTRRRVRVGASSATPTAMPDRAAEHSQVVARLSPTGPSASAELAEVLGNLRRELMHLQRLLPTSTAPDSPDAGPGQAAR
jgi:hypothetical protein